MKRFFLFALLYTLATACSATTFAERVAMAKKVESQKEASAYLYETFFPAVGSRMGEFMKTCLARKGASKDRFTMVANVSLNGELIDIEFESKSNNTAACFSKAVASLKVPPPPLCEYGVLPLVIDMAVTP